MPYFLLLIIALLALALFFKLKAKPTPRVPDANSRRQTKYGQLIGFKDRNNLLSWQGIPYAAAPVGELRWKAPLPPTPWQGLKEALTPGNKPAQIGSATGGFKKALHGSPAGDEDCLYLNIWAPENNTRKLPVMVWIYGGGNAAGAADIPAYNIPYFASAGDVVVVTFNYRLGILGWFYHSALATDGNNPEDASGNYGTLDCVQALRWVNENIAEFGGDPNNVTVFGESAGGINTLSMMLVPSAKGLFHRAIVQSAITTCYNLDESQNYQDDEVPGHEHSSQEVISLLLQQQGLASNPASAKILQSSMSDGAIREFLYGLSSDELLRPFDKVVMGMYQSPRPIADGVVFPSCSWHEAFSDPALHYSVPLLIGANRDEFKLFMAGDTDDYVDMRFGFIPTPKDAERYEMDGRFLSDLWRASAVDEIALRLVEQNTNPVYAYRFDWDNWPRPPFFNLPKLVGAGHGIEVMFMFGLISDHPWLRFIIGRRRFKEICDLSQAIRDYWISFAKSGNPNSDQNGELPEWTAWPARQEQEHSAGLKTILLLDTASNTDTNSGVSLAIAMTQSIVTIDDIRQRMLTHPILCNQPLELQRMYARLFIYGIQGRYWDSVPFSGLENYQPGGIEREQTVACRPALIP